MQKQLDGKNRAPKLSTFIFQNMHFFRPGYPPGACFINPERRYLLPEFSGN